jgi:ABC-2 type transport system permease protein
MNKVRIIARREYMEVLRTKIFWISMLLPILLMVIAIVVGMLHAGPMKEKTFAELRTAAHTRWMGAFVYLFIMFMSMLTPSQMLMTSLIEEKSSRVVEVLLSAVSPFELMAGKILGLVAVGLTTAAIYVASLAVVAGSTGLLQAPSAAMLALFLVYYLFGFAMFASLFAGVGAAFNTLKDAQAVMMPLSLLLILPMMFWMPIVQHPNDLFAVALSIFPLTAPTVMILRIAVLPAPPWWDIGGSLLILAGSVPFIVWAAARIFRTGVLMYGKPPKLGEILRWVRNS